MTGGALTWINAKLCTAKELDAQPWPTWPFFVKALKVQFEPLSKEDWAREQIWKLVQIGNVNTYIYHFRELQNKIPSMNSVEAHNLFRHGLNP